MSAFYHALAPLSAMGAAESRGSGAGTAGRGTASVAGGAAPGVSAISGRKRQYFFGIWEACSFLFSRCAIDTEVK